MAEATGAPTAAHELDAEPLPVKPDRMLADGDTVEIGELTFDVIHLRGPHPRIGRRWRSTGPRPAESPTCSPATACSPAASARPGSPATSSSCSATSPAGCSTCTATRRSSTPATVTTPRWAPSARTSPNGGSGVGDGRRKPVAVVTGASRGAGLGIAHALGSHGCTVYVTGRTEQPGQSPLAGTIHETAELVTAAGGEGIAVPVDHADDEQTKALFDRVEAEQGRLDILVNNAAIIRDEMMGRTQFWEEPVNVIDTLDVGLRSGYVATVYAAP